MTVIIRILSIVHIYEDDGGNNGGNDNGNDDANEHDEHGKHEPIKITDHENESGGIYVQIHAEQIL